MSLLPPIDRRPDGNGPLHHEVRKALALEAGRRLPHDPFPSERTIAKEYGINRLTARKAIEGLVREGILYRVVRRGTFVAPRKDRMRRIVLVCAYRFGDRQSPCPHNALCASLRDEATAARHELIPLVPGRASLDDLRDRLGKLRPDCTILCHPGALLNLDPLRHVGGALLRLGVWLAPGQADTVAADGFAAAVLACEYLNRLGHDRIGIVGSSSLDPGDASCAAIPLFCAGCEAASRRHRFSFPPEGRIVAAEGRERTRLLGELLERPDPPTAFVALDRDLAGEILSLRRKSKGAGPRALDVVAIEVLPNSREALPLASVIVDLRELGELALRAATMTDGGMRRPAYTFLANPTLRASPASEPKTSSTS